MAIFLGRGRNRNIEVIIVCNAQIKKVSDIKCSFFPKYTLISFLTANSTLLPGLDDVFISVHLARPHSYKVVNKLRKRRQERVDV